MFFMKNYMTDSDIVYVFLIDFHMFHDGFEMHKFYPWKCDDQINRLKIIRLFIQKNKSFNIIKISILILLLKSKKDNLKYNNLIKLDITQRQNTFSSLSNTKYTQREQYFVNFFGNFTFKNLEFLLHFTTRCVVSINQNL